MATPVAALVSFRLGGSDGVSVEAAKWAGALERPRLRRPHRGRVRARRPPAPRPGHRRPRAARPTAEIDDALAAADLVVVENLCSLPLNPPAAAAVARVLRARRAVLHHHDLPWQRERFADFPPPPDDPPGST